MGIFFEGQIIGSGALNFRCNLYKYNYFSRGVYGGITALFSLKTRKFTFGNGHRKKDAILGSLETRFIGVTNDCAFFVIRIFWKTTILRKLTLCWSGEVVYQRICVFEWVHTMVAVFLQVVLVCGTKWFQMWMHFCVLRSFEEFVVALCVGSLSLMCVLQCLVDLMHFA